MEKTIVKNGVDYSKYSHEQQHNIAQAYQYICAIVTIVRTPILTKSGKLTVESQKVLDRIESTYLSSYN